MKRLKRRRVSLHELPVRRPHPAADVVLRPDSRLADAPGAVDLCEIKRLSL